MTWLLAVLSGCIVGFSLGLVGGGGSILAVPLLLYVVGIRDVHVAIGTSALAVSASAAANLLGHWRRGNVKWPCAVAFALAGVAGAALGSTLGKAIDGERLLVLFSIVMAVVAAAMLRPGAAGGDSGVHITPAIATRLLALGFLTGLVSGLFGIGGGFLIVPGIMLGSGMPIINAIGSSLFSVAVFGLTTAINYARSGLVNWPVAGCFIAGGIAGGALGIVLAQRLSRRRVLLTRIFAGVVAGVAVYVFVRSCWAAIVVQLHHGVSL